MRRNIMVMGKDEIARMQFERTGRESGTKIELASSVEKAERMLDSAK